MLLFLEVWDILQAFTLIPLMQVLIIDIISLLLTPLVHLDNIVCLQQMENEISCLAHDIKNMQVVRLT